MTDRTAPSPADTPQGEARQARQDRRTGEPLGGAAVLRTPPRPGAEPAAWRPAEAPPRRPGPSNVDSFRGDDGPARRAAPSNVDSFPDGDGADFDDIEAGWDRRHSPSNVDNSRTDARVWRGVHSDEDADERLLARAAGPASSPARPAGAPRPAPQGGDDMPQPSHRPASSVKAHRPRRIHNPYLHNGVATVSIPDPNSAAIEAVREGEKRRLAERAGRAAEKGDSSDEPTRTAGTIQSYRDRGDMLLRRFRRERDVSDDLEQFDPKDFSFWFLSLRPGLKPSTWRFYRQAAVMLLGGIATAKAEDALRIIELDAGAEVEMGTGEAVANPTDKRLTSADKEKQMRWEDWQRIDAQLSLVKRAGVTGALKDWLRAGLSVGLRPSEWANTDVVYGPRDPAGRQQVFLYVLNAKATNGRGNGVVRTIEITPLSEQTQGAIERMSRIGREWEAKGKFSEMQKKAAQHLYRISENFWSRRKLRYSLYSCRHQFIANLKASGMSNEEISALAGHVVDETAAEHYGKKRTAWSVDKITERPRGVREEIATVRRQLVILEERVRLTNIAKGVVRPSDPTPDAE